MDALIISLDSRLSLHNALGEDALAANKSIRDDCVATAFNHTLTANSNAADRCLAPSLKPSKASMRQSPYTWGTAPKRRIDYRNRRSLTLSHGAVHENSLLRTSHRYRHKSFELGLEALSANSPFPSWCRVICHRGRSLSTSADRSTIWRLRNAIARHTRRGFIS